MKKIISIILGVTLAASLLAGCSPSGTPGSSGQKRTVTVCNWGEYLDLDVLAIFEEETGIKVNYKMFETNESLYSILKSGGTSYDVIIPSDYMIARLIEEDMLEKVDFTNISNFSNMDSRFVNPQYDPANEYSVPYMWGTVGIIYNTSMIDEPVEDWDILFNPKYKGQILMFDNSRDAIGIAIKYLGHSYNTTDEAHIHEALNLLLEQKPLVQAYVMDQIFEKLINGEAAVGPYYAGDAVTMMDPDEGNPDLAFCLPSSGSNRFVDAMCIPKGAVNKAEAEAFINFMCRDDISILNSEFTTYSTPLKTAFDELPDDVRENEIIYPDDETLADCEVYLNLPKETRDLYDELWIRLKTE